MKRISRYLRSGLLLAAAGIATVASTAVGQEGFTDVSVWYTNSAPAATLGQYFTVTLCVYNGGWDAATNVVVTNVCPAGLQFISATSSRGTCVTNSGTVSCNLGIILPSQSQTMTMEFKALSVGSFTNTAVGSSDNPDSNPTNSQPSFSTLVTKARFFGVGGTHALYYSTPLLTLLPNNQVLVVGQHLGKTTDLYNMSSRDFSLPAGTMVGVHENGSATLLNNGSVLLAGGGNATGAKTAEVYNPATQLFHQVGDMLVYSYGHYATLQSDGTVVLCGGALSPNELFNPVTETFSAAPTSQCAFNGLYLPTGKFLYFGYGRAYLYDTNTSTSVETSGFLQPRAYQTATLLPNGKVLIAGGYGSWGNAPGPLSSAELYDPVTDTFTWTANLTATRQYHSACLLPDGTVLIAGGQYSGSDPFSLTNAEIYDPNGTVNVPGVGISDASLVEGDSGTNWMEFSVWLTSPSTFPVTVNFATAIGTAWSVDWQLANLDFVQTNGVLTIPAGQTNAIIRVGIIGDLIHEPNETFTLTLSHPTQAWMARAIATGTIIDDDPMPTLSVSPGALLEADYGQSNLTMQVSLSLPTTSTVTVDYWTSDQTATAGSDYLPVAGTLTFGPGTTNLTVEVPVLGDLLIEPDETFWLNISNAQNAVIGTASALGTILNDDGVPGRLRYFDWSPISDPQVQAAGIPVTITARDYFGNVATNVPWPVRLSAQTTNYVATNLDFEGPTLDPWVTFNYTPYAKSFTQTFADVSGTGQLSRALRTGAGGGTNGIEQDIYLTGGIPYVFSANIMFGREESGDSTCWGGSLDLQVGTNTTSVPVPTLCYGYAWGTISMSYTPPTNGIYPLRFVIYRSYFWVSDSYFVYLDDVQISYPVVTPTMVTNFSNGVWTGVVTALQSGANISLLANDNAGHKGVSNPFNLLPSTDLGLSVTTNWNSTLRTGDRLTFNLAVTNRGPSAVSDAMMSWAIPTNLTFLSASNLQGTITNQGGVLQWMIGSLAVGSNVTASLVARADIPGLFTNTFTLTNSIIDLNLSDNLKVVAAQVNPPLLTISDASAYESNAATVGIAFAVRLSGPSGQIISMDYFTADGTATNGVDYFGTNGTLVFAPGTTNASLVVFAPDDILDEPDRSFSVLLTNVVNAIVSDGLGIGTVLDDDPPPTITIADTSVVEGDSGTRNAVFQLTLNKPAIVDVSVRCTTVTNSASTNDFISTVTTVVFPAGQTNTTFTVPVIGNTVNEPDETFFVNLSLPSNATIARSQAIGTILNDDAVPGRLDHFTWDAIPSSPSHYRGVAFPVILRAVDYLGNPASNGVGSAIVTARTENGFTNRLQDDFEDGDTIGWTNFNSSFTAAVTNETAAQGSNSLRLTGSTASTTAGFRRSFSNSQPNRISFSVRVGRTNQVAGRLTAYLNGLYRSAVFYFDNKGQMGLLDSQRVLHGVSYQSNQWYHVDLYFNWGSQKVDCRIDGNLVITNITFPESITSMDAIVLANQDNTTSWFDDIRVYSDNLTNVFTITPSNFTAFANGAKSNAVTIQGTGTNIFLAADDGLEHVGKSGFFDLLPVTLSLVTPASFTEGNAPTNGQVIIPVAFPQAVTVNLTSSAPARITMPASVLIAPNQTNASFSLGVVDDSIADWTKSVQIVASGTNVDATTNAITIVDNDPAMGISQYGRMANGSFQIGLQGPPAQNFVLFASSNLMDWSSISNVTFSNGPVMIIDPASTNFDHRYYRLAPAGP